MRLAHKSVGDVSKMIKAIVKKYADLKDYRLFYFGSRLSGKGDERSDIDVGIEGPEALPLETLARIREELDNLPILYSIDFVDFRNADEDFRKVALNKIEPIK